LFLPAKPWFRSPPDIILRLIAGRNKPRRQPSGIPAAGFLRPVQKTAKRVLDSVFQDGITRSLSALENTFAGKLLVPPFRLLDRMPG
jgi:hypothetical protein